ncbi:MAG: hypothetical protein ACRDRP_23125 [Pseudonocardiaceae bacterium]
MRTQPVTLALLKQYPVQTGPHAALQRKVSQDVPRVSDGEQLRQISSGLSDRHKPRSCRGRGRTLLLTERVHQLAEILGKPVLAVASCTSSYL